MRSKRTITDALSDIVDNIDRIDGYMVGLSQETFVINPLVRDAVERCLERICEAAHRLGPSAVELVPGQPWADIRGMGKHLRHAYDRIAIDVVWNTVTNRLPSLRHDAVQALDAHHASREG